jgi:mRNA interferase MazF
MKRGEVWEVRLDPIQGSEMKKNRPFVIVSNDLMGRLPLKIVVPLTAWKAGFQNAPWHIYVKKAAENGLSKTSSADTYQVRSILESRLIRKLGSLLPEEMEKINQGLSISLSLE